jgi:hypothetical protein
LFTVKGAKFYRAVEATVGNNKMQQLMAVVEAQERADLETLYANEHEGTVISLANLYSSVTGEDIDGSVDLLQWFFLNYVHDGVNRWVNRKEIVIH